MSRMFLALTAVLFVTPTALAAPARYVGLTRDGKAPSILWPATEAAPAGWRVVVPATTPEAVLAAAAFKAKQARSYQTLSDAKGRLALWPLSQEAPRGWTITGHTCGAAECLRAPLGSYQLAAAALGWQDVGRTAPVKR